MYGIYQSGYAGNNDRTSCFFLYVDGVHQQNDVHCHMIDKYINVTLRTNVCPCKQSEKTQICKVCKVQNENLVPVAIFKYLPPYLE